MDDQEFANLLDELQADLPTHEELLAEMEAQRRPKEELIEEMVGEYDDLAARNPKVAALSKEAWAAVVRRFVGYAYRPIETLEFQEKVAAELERREREGWDNA